MPRFELHVCCCWHWHLSLRHRQVLRLKSPFIPLIMGEIVSKVSVKDRCLLLELVWSTRAYSTVTSRGFSMFSCSFLLRHRHLSGDHVEISFYSLIMGKMLVKCIMASSLGSTWLKLKGTVCIASSCKHPSSLLYGSIFWRQIFRNEW